jgi:hypothetical protein
MIGGEVTRVFSTAARKSASNLCLAYSTVFFQPAALCSAVARLLRK